LFQVVQVEWNLLNQCVLDEIADASVAAGVTVTVRSVFLQGVLTPKGAALPPHLRDLAAPRARAEQAAASLGIPLNALALRAALGHPARPLVIVGPDREDQLDEIAEHARMGPLDQATLRQLTRLDVGGDLVDPRTWRVGVN
jgi:aryl-alcohol dehydrogenase-like predicted oxidoreductase